MCGGFFTVLFIEKTSRISDEIVFVWKHYLCGGLLFDYRIIRNSGRGSYHFVRLNFPKNWVSAALISGAAIIKFRKKNYR